VRVDFFAGLARDAVFGSFFDRDRTPPPCLPKEPGDEDGEPEVDLEARDWDSDVFCVELGWTLGLTSVVCAAVGDNPAEYTNAEIRANERNLRKCPATSSNYRRKLLPRRETSSSARLRISS
jgi:hypothetical protein